MTDFREALARELCRQAVPWNWRGRDRDAWVEIEWKGYLKRADAILALPVFAEILADTTPTPQPPAAPPEADRSDKVCLYPDGCPMDGPVCHLCAHVQPNRNASGKVSR